MRDPVTANLLVAAICLGLVGVSGGLALWMFRYLRRRVAQILDYSELECRPLGLADLSPGTRRHFDELTPEITRLSFRPLGDYLLKRTIFARRFLSADGCAVAEIVATRFGLLSAIRSFDFISVLSDGTYL